jgi:phosphatidylserine decarboxylase
LLGLINEIPTTATVFGEPMAATPLTAVHDWAMGTTAGRVAFRDPRINDICKSILTAWSSFLNSLDSRYVLNDSPSGWTSECARQTVGIEQFEHDPDDPYCGFTSWNDFFTRPCSASFGRVTDDVRTTVTELAAVPIASPV